MNNGYLTHEKGNGIEFYKNELELMDYLLVIWKWKYLIIAGTLAFGFVTAIISFIVIKQQSIMYHTVIVFKPRVLKIDENGNKIFIDSPENIKTLIENDLIHKVLDDSTNSKKTKLTNSTKLQVDIPKGSDNINVYLESASVEDNTHKLNYLIKVLSTELTDRFKLIKRGMEKLIEEKTYEFEILLFKEKELRAMTIKYEKELSVIEAKIKFLKDSKEITQNKESILTKLSLENAYRNTFQIYFKEIENSKIDLFELQKRTKKLSKEIEKLEKEKNNIQTIQVIQPPTTTELPQKYKVGRNIILSLVAGLLLMLFFSFFLEYLNNYKKRLNNK